MASASCPATRTSRAWPAVCARAGAWSSAWGRRRPPRPSGAPATCLPPLSCLCRTNATRRAAAATRCRRTPWSRPWWTSSLTIRTTARPQAWARSAAACRSATPISTCAATARTCYRSCSRSSRGCASPRITARSPWSSPRARSASRRRRSPSAQGRPRRSRRLRRRLEQKRLPASRPSPKGRRPRLRRPRLRRRSPSPRSPRSRIAARAAIAARVAWRRRPSGAWRKAVRLPPRCPRARRSSKPFPQKQLWKHRSPRPSKWSWRPCRRCGPSPRRPRRTCGPAAAPVQSARPAR